MKKLFSVVLILLICVGMLAGCNKNDNNLEISNNYLAQGTIPSDAKLHPIVMDDMPMNIIYEGDAKGQITAEDINTITTYIDMYTALCDNNGAEDYDDSALSFLSGFTSEDLIDYNEENGVSTVLLGCQIINLAFPNSNEAEVLVLSSFEGSISEQEGIFSQLTTKSLVKTNGKWYIIGSQSLFLNLAESFTIERNAIDGKIYVNMVE